MKKYQRLSFRNITFPRLSVVWWWWWYMIYIVRVMCDRRTYVEGGGGRIALKL